MTGEIPSLEVIRQFQQALIQWFSQRGRDLPWRMTKDPYKVLLAEILLQQTDARKALRAYELLVERFPNPQALSVAEPSEVEDIVAPIGLRYRAGRLHRLASVMAKGGLPCDEQELLKLHGVGRYMARAVLCFAFDRPVGVLDTNVLRILDRVFGIRSTKSRPHTDRQLWDLVNLMTPLEGAKEYNWALLDLAAGVCRARRPKCGECPLDMCQFRHQTQQPRELGMLPL